MAGLALAARVRAGFGADVAADGLPAAAGFLAAVGGLPAADGFFAAVGFLAADGLLGFGAALAVLGLAAGCAGADARSLSLVSGGAPLGRATRLSLRRWGRVRGSDPMTPGLR